MPLPLPLTLALILLPAGIALFILSPELACKLIFWTWLLLLGVAFVTGTISAYLLLTQ